MINIIRHILHPHKQLSTIDETANRHYISRALRRLNCKYRWEVNGEDQVVNYDFQGGHFMINVTKRSPYVRLSFLFIATDKMEHLDIVRQLCNQCNLNSDGVRFMYTINEEKNTIDIHLLNNLLLDADRATDILTMAMQDMFGWQNAYVQQVGKVTAASDRFLHTDLEQDRASMVRQLSLIREQELSHQEVNPGWRASRDHSITLAEWLDLAYDFKDVKPISLIINNDTTATITDADAIMTTDITQVIIDGNDFRATTAVMTLTFTVPSRPSQRRFMSIFLQQASLAEATLYVRITSTLAPLAAKPTMPLGGNDNLPLVRSALIAYDLKSPKKKLEEFNYMWQDAQDKMKANNLSALSDEQVIIAGVVDHEPAFLLYRGRQLFLDKRYAEALPLLLDAFEVLYTSFSTPKKRNHARFLEVCYMIGFCFDELREFDRANYYLSFTLGANQITYTEEYVNNLVNAGDFRSLSFIDNLLQDVINSNNLGPHDDDDDEEEEEDDNPELRSFVNFLRRRKAYVLVDMRRLEEAEALLNEMLGEPENADFAKGELEYIKQLKQ